MPDEIFDVVDENDVVIGRNTRAEVHRLGLRHRAVHVLVFNSRGQIFLQKRSMKKDCFPGAWDSSAAGHLDCGEDYDRCAARELKEELGLVPSKPPQKLFRIAACAETGMEHVWVYRCEAEGPFVLNPDELEDGQWFEPSYVTLWVAERPQDFASALISIWQRYLSSPQVH